MKKFLEEYGFAILACIVVICLIVISTPIKNTIQSNTNKLIDKFSNVASSKLDATEINLKANDIIEIENKKYVVLQKKGGTRYLIMDINGIGNREFNTDGNGQDPNKCKYDSISGRWSYETCSNQYEGSNIDQYLNGEYYNSLPQDVKEAIVDTDIQQNYYSHVSTNPKYKWVNKGDMNYDGCNNTVCAFQPNGRWVTWDRHTPIKGEMGSYKYNLQGDTDDFGNKTKVINRKVFLPSINEVSSIVNVLDQWEMDKFLRNDNGDYMTMWFRDSRSSSSASAINGGYNIRSLDSSIVYYAYLNVRPAFVVDLSKIDFVDTNKTFVK